MANNFNNEPFLNSNNNENNNAVWNGPQPVNVPEPPDVLRFNNQGRTSLPALPEGSTTLLVQRNRLKKLPPIPSSIERLNCSYNQLTELPKLPEYLLELNCEHNLLTSLPELPDMILYLKCNNNPLTNLPPDLKGLSDLEIKNCPITHLAPLPETLRYLDCQSCKLTYLPPLPIRLKRDWEFKTTFANNPLQEPFKTWVSEFEVDEDMNKLRERVNIYWRENKQRYKDFMAYWYTLGYRGSKNIPGEFESGPVANTITRFLVGNHGVPITSNKLKTVKSQMLHRLLAYNRPTTAVGGKRKKDKVKQRKTQKRSKRV